MKSSDKKNLKQKIENTFFHVVRTSLNDGKSKQCASEAKTKYPGLTRDALADVLIKRASRKTAASGAVGGGAVTACEAAIAGPVPEPTHKVAAFAGIGAAIVADLSAATAIQMRLLQEIGHIYDCPFDQDDEEDVWLVFLSAMGLKGIEQVGGYARFIFQEAAKKQFRTLLRTGIRSAVQNKVIKIAGEKAGRLLAERTLLKLIWLMNIPLGAGLNYALTKRVGKWSKVRARIRSGMFRTLDAIKLHDSETAALVLPIIFHTGTATDKLTDNTLALYAQTAKHLKLSDEEVAAIDKVNEDCSLEDLIKAQWERLKNPELRMLLLEAGIITAASSRLEFVNEHNECLLSLSKCLEVEYSKNDLTSRIATLKG
jgi:hypothetical protein